MTPRRGLAGRCTFLALLVASSMTWACAYKAPTAPTTSTTSNTTPSTTPASIRLTASSRSDQTLDITATVLTSDGGFVAGVPVTFTIGSGTITPQASATDTNGVVHATATTSAATTVTAVCSNVTSSVSVTASTIASPAPTPTPSPSPSPSPAPTPSGFILNLPSTGTVGQSVTMFVSASANAGPFSWNFGDNSATVSTTTYSTSHIFQSPGGFTVTVSGPAGSASQLIAVSNPSSSTTPTASLSATIVCSQPSTTTLAVKCNVSQISYNGSTLPASSITNVSWDWGDGTRDEVGTPTGSRTYTQVGTYTIFATVTATTSGGSQSATTSVSQQVKSS